MLNFIHSVIAERSLPVKRIVAIECVCVIASNDQLPSASTNKENTTNIILPSSTLSPPVQITNSIAASVCFGTLLHVLVPLTISLSVDFPNGG